MNPASHCTLKLSLMLALLNSPLNDFGTVKEELGDKDMSMKTSFTRTKI